MEWKETEGKRREKLGKGKCVSEYLIEGAIILLGNTHMHEHTHTLGLLADEKEKERKPVKLRDIQIVR